MRFKKRHSTIKLLGALCLSMFASSGFAQSHNPVVCNNEFALCNAAACQEIPGSAGRALCKCSIWHGKNIGYSTCQKRKPQVGPYKQTKLLSTFSFGGMHFKYMTCPASNAWTNCLDQKCLINKNHPRVAYCNCKIESGTRYVTLAGMCNTNNCSKSMWSGAKIADNLKLVKLLGMNMHYKTTPERSCSI